MAMHKKTKELINQAYSVLQEYNPMTLRQVYYQLVSKHFIENKLSEYQRLSSALVKARQMNSIPWDWIEDRVRQPRIVSMWNDLPDFIETVKVAYRKNVWDKQSDYIEIWLEKDALSGIFENVIREYGITLIVGRGYNSWSAYREAINRFSIQDKKNIYILYFGDFDPSGEDIVRALEESLNFFGIYPKVKKIALTIEDITTYNLPPDFTKKTDTRTEKFVEKYGDLAVELDALSLPILQEKIRESIKGHLDMEAFDKVKKIEEQERQELSNLI